MHIRRAGITRDVERRDTRPVAPRTQMAEKSAARAGVAAVAAGCRAAASVARGTGRRGSGAGGTRSRD